MGNTNQIDNNTHPFISKSIKAPGKNSDSDTFKQTFGKVLEDMEPVKMETAQSEGLKELSAQSFNLPDASADLSYKAESLLELLELYSAKLEDGSVSLKDIDSLLKEIKIDAENLLKKIESSPDADERIKNIAKEFATFANTESIKFQRGDYLS